MKEYLAANHQTLQKDVFKRLVVSIKRMEWDLSFFENNWQLFKSPNLDYINGVVDVEDVDEAEIERRHMRKLRT